MTAGDTPSFVADSPIKLRGAWMPPSGEQPGEACAQGFATLHPRAACDGRSKRGGPQSVWLRAQGFLLGTPSSGTSRAKRIGLRAELRALRASHRTLHAELKAARADLLHVARKAKSLEPRVAALCARSSLACAQGWMACGRRFLPCAPGKPAGARAPVRDLEVSTVLVIVLPIQIQTLGSGAWKRVLGCWSGAGGCRGGMLGRRWATRRRWAGVLAMPNFSGRDKTAAAGRRAQESHCKSIACVHWHLRVQVD